MSKTLKTRFLEEQEFDGWNRFVEASATGSIYSRSDYLRILSAVTGGQFHILATFRGTELQGGIALYEQRRWFGPYISSRLLLYYNGVVLQDYRSRYPSEVTSRHLAALAALLDALPGRGYARVLLHCRRLADVRPFLADGWQAWPTYSYEVPIDDLEQLWSRVEQNQRRLVRRCEEQGGVITDDDDFDSFFELHLQTHRRKGAPLYLPRDKYRTYVKQLLASGLGKLYHVRLPDGSAIASQLVLLGHHATGHVVCAAADSQYLKTGATPFLRWKVFERLAALGYKAVDLTDATLNPVTRFKSQLGGDLICNMVVQRPDSRLYRWDRSLSRLAAHGRAALGKIARTMGRGSDE